MIVQSTSVALVATLLLVSSAFALENRTLPQDPEPHTQVNSLGAIDTEHVATLTGVVKFVHVGPERSRVQVLVTSPQGQAQEWSLEGPTQNIIAQFGSRRRAIAQWDTVTFDINPLTDAAASGEIRAPMRPVAQ